MSRGKKSKGKTIPSFGGDIPPQKMPRVSPGFDTAENNNPVWQVRNIELGGPFGWQVLTRDLFLDNVLPKIKNLESMTWGEILCRNNHEVRVADLDKEAQKRLQTLKLDDVDQLVSLRLSGRERIWGIRIRSTLRLLWWDPDHKVCPSLLKHT